MNEFKNSGTDRLTDTADIASNLIEDEIVMSIAQGEAKEIEQIDNALKKIKKGKYGNCENCGKSINKQRLMAIPFVNLCIKCKEDEERYEGSELTGKVIDLILLSMRVLRRRTKKEAI